jgi:hypothetical protein
MLGGSPTRPWTPCPTSIGAIMFLRARTGAVLGGVEGSCDGADPSRLSSPSSALVPTSGLRLIGHLWPSTRTSPCQRATTRATISPWACCGAFGRKFLTFHFQFVFPFRILCSIDSCGSHLFVCRPRTPTSRRRGRTRTSSGSYALTGADVRWTSYSEEAIAARAPQGLSTLCFRDQQYWMMRSLLLFDMYVEEYAIHRVLRQFGRYQEWPVPVVHTIPSAHHR